MMKFIVTQPNQRLVGWVHRHLRETDRLLAIVGSPTSDWAMALNPGANQYTGPAFSIKACFMVAGAITTSVNKGRWAVPMSGLLV